MNGYEVAFDGGGTSDPTALLSLQSTISVFSDMAGARAMVNLLQESAPVDLHEISLSNLGDQHFVAESAPSSDDLTGTIYRFVAVRKGRVVVAVAAESLRGATLDQVIQLAQKPLGRIP
jgi:hypothetical protein